MDATSIVSTAAAPKKTNKDYEVIQPPDDSVSALEFSPDTMQQTYLIASSWDNSVRCWEVQQSGETLPRAIQSMTMPILDVCWIGDGTKVFMASCNKQVNCWDLVSNQTMQVAAHDAPVSICHWITSPSYACLMTGSWDKTLKFWDLRSSTPIRTHDLHEKVYCADVEYPFAVVGTGGKGVSIFQLEEPSLLNCTTSLRDQHRCITLLKDKTTRVPTGFAVGNDRGRVAIFLNLKSQNPSDQFSFKCHRRLATDVQNTQDIYAVNDIKCHPVHDTLATVGSDATFAFWDKDARTKLSTSDILDEPITKCCFNKNGQIFAYSTGYDWSKGHEFNNPNKKSKIFLRPCFEEMKPKLVPT